MSDLDIFHSGIIINSYNCHILEEFLKRVKASVLPNREVPLPDGLESHPIASRTSWYPLKTGGTSFTTHHLRFTSDQIAVFVSSSKYRLMAVFISLIGLGTFIAILGSDVFSREPLGGVFGILASALFIFMGIWLFREADKQIIFDYGEALFWKGKRPTAMDRTYKSDTWCKLDEIAGIQLLYEHYSRERKDRVSYELNLVLRSGRRLHVIDHANLTQIQKDAHQLAGFLGIPVWDGI